MLVKNWMSTELIFVDENISIINAIKIMKDKRIRRLPILKEERLIGIVTDRDLKEASPSKATSLDVHELYSVVSEIKVKDVMSKDPATVLPDDTIMKAASIMLENKISGIPVLSEEGKLVGIITETDIFKLVVSITGIYQERVQFALELEDRPGSIKEVEDIIRSYNGRVLSILSARAAPRENYRQVYFFIKELELEKLDALERELREKYNVLYIKAKE
jgi:acetoin utilization protein AcuB